MYSKYYHYENRLTSGEEFKYDENIMSDINEKQQKKNRTKPKKKKKKTMWEKCFPCCYNEKNDKRNKKKNKEEIKTPLIISKDENNSN